MTRKLSSMEVRITLASMARMPPDDLDGYVVILCKGPEVVGVMTNADGEATTIGLLARAIEHRAQAVGVMEDKLAAQ